VQHISVTAYYLFILQEMFKMSNSFISIYVIVLVKWQRWFDCWISSADDNYGMFLTWLALVCVIFVVLSLITVQFVTLKPFCWLAY